MEFLFYFISSYCECMVILENVMPESHVLKIVELVMVLRILKLH